MYVTGWLYWDRACSDTWDLCLWIPSIKIFSFLQLYLNLLKFLVQMHRYYVAWHFASKKNNGRRNTLFSTTLGFELPSLWIRGKRLIHYTVCAQVEGPLSQLAFILSIAVKNLSLSNFSMHAHTFYLRSDKVAFKHIKQSLNHKMYVFHNTAYVWTQFLFAWKYLLSKII